MKTHDYRVEDKQGNVTIVKDVSMTYLQIGFIYFERQNIKAVEYFNVDEVKSVTVVEDKRDD